MSVKQLQMAKALMLGALRGGDADGARGYLNEAREHGATWEELAWALSIPTPQPDAAYQIAIARKIGAEVSR